jgi:hypothetical protein
LGAAFHRIRPNVEALRDLIEAAPDGLIWIVGRREDKGEHYPGEWHLQGVSDNEQTAIAMCRDENYFVGPLPVNVLLPHRTIEWIGLYWPKRKADSKPDEIKM